MEESDVNKLMQAFENVTNHIETQRANSLHNYQTRISNPQFLIEFFQDQLRKDSWLVFSEALPISKGIAPNEMDVVGVYTMVWYTETKALLEAAQANKTLAILNPDDKPKAWRVIPKNFVKWLHEKDIRPLPELESALNLIPKAKKTAITPLNEIKNWDQAERHAAIRERFYIAALYLIANYPERFKKANGEWEIGRIEKTIALNSKIWFGEEILPLEGKKVREHIGNAIRAIKDEKLIFPQRR